MRELFTIVLQFRESTVGFIFSSRSLLTSGLQDNFYNHCLSESARRDAERDLDRVSICNEIEEQV